MTSLALDERTIYEAVDSSVCPTACLSTTIESNAKGFFTTAVVNQVVDVHTAPAVVGNQVFSSKSTAHNPTTTPKANDINDIVEAAWLRHAKLLRKHTRRDYSALIENPPMGGYVSGKGKNYAALRTPPMPQPSSKHGNLIVVRTPYNKQVANQSVEIKAAPRPQPQVIERIVSVALSPSIVAQALAKFAAKHVDVTMNPKMPRPVMGGRRKLLELAA